MSVEHDNLPISPRLDTLLRQIVAAGDLQPEQNQRVRAQLGLHPHQPTGRPTMTLPSSQPGPIHAPEQEGIPMISTTRARLRQQWLQFALAAVAFIAAGVVLALLFGSGSDEPEALPRASESIVFLHWLPEHEQFARQPTPTASPQPGDLPRGPAEISGELVVEGSCLRLEQTASGEAVLLIWPPEYVFEASAEGGQIRDDTGAAVVTVGGSVSFEGAFLAAGTDLPSFLNDPQASACAVPSYFLVGRVSTTTAATPAATDTSYEQVAPDLPTPDVTGSYNGLTLEQMVEQAQQVVPFEITVPQQIPDGLEAPAITVVTSPLPAVSGQVYRIEMLFELSGNESPSKSVLFTQTLSPVSSNPPEGETTTFGTPIGINVNRTTSTDAAGDPLLVYWWENNDIDYQILAAPEGDLTPGVVEDLMLSILVPPPPTAEEETARLEQERTEMMPFPIPDTCAASDWAGPDFRVGQQYASAYFIDGDGLSLWTTHGVLFAGENEITWLADAPLTTTEALSGPETIRVVRSGADEGTTEIPIDVTEQLHNVRDTERAWWSSVSFPSEGCWEISVSLGAHVLEATVYVYARP